MKLAAFFLLVSGSFLYGIDGTVINDTTQKPQAGVKVRLVHPGQNGMQQLGSAETDANGKFQIDKEVPAPPALLQADYKGVNYNLVLAPGAPSSGVTMTVNDTTTAAIADKMEQHIYVFEPTSEQLRVSETFLFSNDTKATFQDAAKGSVQVFIPGEPRDGLQVTVEAPGGMPIRRPLTKTAQPNIYKLDFPIKPGETRFDLSYTMPSAEKFAVKLVRTDGPTRLATPGSVTLSGENIRDLGQEPQTQARLYEVTGNSFDANIVGVGSLHRGGDEDSGASKKAEEDSGAPQIQEVQARIYNRLYWVLGLAFAALALGGTYLFRKGAA